jgi:hypothetical protein
MDTSLLLAGLITIDIGFAVLCVIYISRIITGLNSMVKKQDALMAKLIEIKNR